MRFTGDDHLWVIISDPEQDPDQVLLVMFNTLRDLHHDPACVLDTGDHPFINRPTWVNYRRARKVRLVQLVQLEADGRLERHATCSEVTLRRIQAGAAESDHLAYQHFAILDAQGLRDFDP